MKSVSAMELGHSVDGIQKLCIELATAFHANYHVAATIPGTARPALYLDFDDHFEETLSTTCIELAVSFRLLLERAGGYLSEEELNLATSCIEVHEGHGRRSLRECANKLIHASRLLFSHAQYSTTLVGAAPFENAVKESSVELQGYFGERRWSCTIDLLKFAEEVYEKSTELRETLAGLIR